MENRNILIGMGTGLVAGFLLGYGTGAYFTTGSGVQAPPKAPAPMAAPPGQAPPMEAQGQMDAITRIPQTLDALKRDPANAEAWISLGNDYFDTHQPKLSVEAYAKAITLAPKHPRLADVLTDRGVMFRELKEYKKAIADFQEAGKVSPGHLPSLINQGVVYANDLHDLPAARKAWNRVIELAPGSPQAQQAKQFLSGI